MSKKKQAEAVSLPSVLDSLINDREVDKVEKVRKIKEGPVTFHIRLTAEQKLAKATVLENVVTFLKGEPGTAKSTIACHAALDRLIKGHVDKIILTRPIEVVGKDMGFLPGVGNSATEGKMAPYISPLLDTMYDLRSKKEIDDMIEAGKIEVLPVQFVRGKNFKNVFVVIDESQNMTVDDMIALVTRICPNSWMVFTSDLNQIDLHDKHSSAANFVQDIHAKFPGVAVVELLENFRHPLAIQIMKYLQEKVVERKEQREHKNEVFKNKPTVEVLG